MLKQEVYVNQTTGGLFQEEVLTHLSVFHGKKMILSSYTDRVTGTNLNNCFVDTWYVFQVANSQLKHLTQEPKSDRHYNELI